MAALVNFIVGLRNATTPPSPSAEAIDQQKDRQRGRQGEPQRERQRGRLEALAAEVASLLKQHNQTVSIAESSTGGLISAALLAVPGASAYFLGGSVIYTLKSRRQILSIGREDVAGLSPMTEAMAQPFAAKARDLLDATWGVAELGVAGPTPVRYSPQSPEIPAGSSVIAVAGPKTLSTTVITGHNNREQNMWAFTASALQLLADAIKTSEQA